MSTNATITNALNATKVAYLNATKGAYLSAFKIETPPVTAFLWMFVIALCLFCTQYHKAAAVSGSAKTRRMYLNKMYLPHSISTFLLVMLTFHFILANLLSTGTINNYFDIPLLAITHHISGTSTLYREMAEERQGIFFGDTGLNGWMRKMAMGGLEECLVRQVEEEEDESEG